MKFSLPFAHQRLLLGAVLALFALGSVLCCRYADEVLWADGVVASVEVLPDVAADLKITEISGDGRKWSTGRLGESLFPKPGRALWVRVVLRNPGDAALRGVLADEGFYSDHVDLYEDEGAGGRERWRCFRSGERIPAVEKPLGGREAAFPVELVAGATRTLYLRIEDHFGIPSRLVWWPSQQAYLISRTRANFAEALYFGVLLVLLFYNGVLWIRLRFPDLGRYLLYLAGLAVYMFIARNQWLVLGGSVHSPWQETAALLALGCSLIFLLDFARVFLELKRRAPSWDRLMGGLRWVAVAAVLFSPGLLWMREATLFHATVILGFLVQALLLIASLVAWRYGAAQARYFAAAFAAFLLGLLPSLRMVVWPAPQDDTAVAGFAFLAGSALELLLFSLATADRFSRLQQEKLAAEAALRREAEQREIMQEAYADDLALEVQERTRELELANADKDRILAVLGHDLRGPLTGLNRAAGHWETRPALAPGLQQFVADTARTSQGLLLLIEDLVMWARLRAGTSTADAHLLATLTSPVLTLLQNEAASAGVQLTASVPPQLSVLTDAVPLQALLRNLVANGLRAARKHVCVRAVVVAEGVEISVCDDGPGLPHSLANALNAGDTGQLPVVHGLGLRLCMEISLALDLGLGVRSAGTASEGTEFHFILRPDLS